jgi:hypothetical protein
LRQRLHGFRHVENHRAVAHAQTSAAGDSAAAPGTPSRFEQLDRSRDGFVSRDEAKDAEELHTRFTELDSNNDNKLSREEYAVLGSERNASTGATGQPGKPAGTEGRDASASRSKGKSK